MPGRLARQPLQRALERLLGFKPGPFAGAVRGGVTVAGAALVAGATPRGVSPEVSASSASMGVAPSAKPRPKPTAIPFQL